MALNRYILLWIALVQEEFCCGDWEVFTLVNESCGGNRGLVAKYFLILYVTFATESNVGDSG